ncbi:MAG: PBSX family phage terminase large subunit [Vampirovibrionales bacterium]
MQTQIKDRPAKATIAPEAKGPEGKVLDIPVARVFQPLLKPSRYKGIHGGRGSGKSTFDAQAIVTQCMFRPGLRVVCVRETQNSLKESVYQLIIDQINKLGVASAFTVQSSRIITPGNGLVIFQGMQDHTSESIKSLEGFDIAWCEEAQTMSSRSLEILRPTIRKDGSELWFTWNPRNASDPVDQLLRCEHPPKDAVVIKANYMDNPWMPDVLNEERLYDQKFRPDRYGHIWLGEYEPTAVGAIWSRQVLHENRRHEVPRMARILVAVDPSVTVGERSDENGIVVVGKGEDGRGYVLDDMSMRGSPSQWAQRAVSAFDSYEADAIVAEVNQGGLMVKNTIMAVRPSVPVIEVRATRGKHVRAEPISALYNLGRISHIGTFPELEAQMCKMTAAGYDGEGSPDRVDALVWGFTQLFEQIARGPEVMKPVVIEPISWRWR